MDRGLGRFGHRPLCLSGIFNKLLGAGQGKLQIHDLLAHLVQIVNERLALAEGNQVEALDQDFLGTVQGSGNKNFLEREGAFAFLGNQHGFDGNARALLTDVINPVMWFTHGASVAEESAIHIIKGGIGHV